MYKVLVMDEDDMSLFCAYVAFWGMYFLYTRSHGAKRRDRVLKFARRSLPAFYGGVRLFGVFLDLADGEAD